jgi:hypothetical protein
MDACELVEKPPKDLRMVSIGFEKPNLDGFAMVYRGENMVGLFTHDLSAGSAFYMDPLVSSQKDLIWIYRPLMPGELVNDCCTVKRVSPATCFGFMLHTTENIGLVGPCFAFPTNSPTASHLVAMDDRLCQVYHSYCDPLKPSSRIKYVGVKSGLLENEARRDVVTLDMTDLKAPFDQTLETIDPMFCSCIPLSRVTAVSLCHDKRYTDGRIMGIMFYFPDGVRRCSGQYRPDWATSAQRVDRTKWLRFGVKYDSKSSGFQVVVIVDVHGLRCDQLTKDKEVRWATMPWRGRLDWKFLGNGRNIRRWCNIDTSEWG